MTKKTTKTEKLSTKPVEEVVETKVEEVVETPVEEVVEEVVETPVEEVVETPVEEVVETPVEEVVETPVEEVVETPVEEVAEETQAEETQAEETQAEKVAEETPVLAHKLTLPTIDNIHFLVNGELAENEVIIEHGIELTIEICSNFTKEDGTKDVLYKETWESFTKDHVFECDENLLLSKIKFEPDSNDSNDSPIGIRIEKILEIKNYYSHLVCGRYFVGVGLNETSLRNFYTEFGAYCTDSLDIELFSLLDEFFNSLDNSKSSEE